MIFAVVDAARSLDLLTSGPRAQYRFESLYRGKRAHEFTDVAPYLVEFAERNEMIDHLVNKNWSRSWGVLVSTAASVEALRTHLRKFLMVKLEDGRQVYFRYYDPRVLNVFLPTCTAEQLQSFFGPVITFWAAGERPGSCMSYSLDDGTLRCSEFDVADWSLQV